MQRNLLTDTVTTETGFYNTPVFVPANIKALLNERDYNLFLFDPDFHCDKYLPMLTKVHRENFPNSTSLLWLNEVDPDMAKEHDPNTQYFWSKPLAHKYTFIAVNPHNDVVAYATFSLHRGVYLLDPTVNIVAEPEQPNQSTPNGISYLDLSYIGVASDEKNNGIGSVVLAALEINANALSGDQKFKLSHFFLYSIPSAKNFYLKCGEFVRDCQGEWNFYAKLPINSEKIENRLIKFQQHTQIINQSLYNSQNSLDNFTSNFFPDIPNFTSELNTEPAFFADDGKFKTNQSLADTNEKVSLPNQLSSTAEIQSIFENNDDEEFDIKLFLVDSDQEENQLSNKGTSIEELNKQNKRPLIDNANHQNNKKIKRHQEMQMNFFDHANTESIEDKKRLEETKLSKTENLHPNS